MGAKVVALESDPGAAEDGGRSVSAARICDRGALDSGAPKLAPFDVIVIEGAFSLSPRR